MTGIAVNRLNIVSFVTMNPLRSRIVKIRRKRLWVNRTNRNNRPA